MKNLFIIIALATTMFACKKEEDAAPLRIAEDTTQVAPIDSSVNFYYYLRGSRIATKFVYCYLWNSNEQGDTLELIDKVITTVNASRDTIVLKHDHSPYQYAVVTFRVQYVDTEDDMWMAVWHGETPDSNDLYYDSPGKDSDHEFTLKPIKIR